MSTRKKIRRKASSGGGTKSTAETIEFLEKISGGPLTLARVLVSIRRSEDLSQSELARMLGISRQLLNDIERGRRQVNLEKAANFAKALGHPESYFVKLALQSLIDEAGLNLKVDVA